MYIFAHAPLSERLEQATLPLALQYYYYSLQVENSPEHSQLLSPCWPALHTILLL